MANYEDGSGLLVESGIEDAPSDVEPATHSSRKIKVAALIVGSLCVLALVVAAPGAVNHAPSRAQTSSVLTLQAAFTDAPTDDEKICQKIAKGEYNGDSLCKPWCSNEKHSDVPWLAKKAAPCKQKCNWKNCNGCPDCTCADWCSSKKHRETPWAKKCNWVNCRECSECSVKEPRKTCSLNTFEGRTYKISQESSLHGNAQYTYIVKIGGEINQLTSNSGNYLIGKHESYSGATEKFGNGARCGSTPRSATVTYTYGSEAKLLSAKEPSKCKYDFKIQLPEGDCR